MFKPCVNPKHTYAFCYCSVYVFHRLSLLCAVMEQIKWLVAVLLLPLVAAVSLSEFYEFNTARQCSIPSGETANDKLNENCEETLFPRSVDANILYQTNTRFPFFDKKVSTINVSHTLLEFGCSHDTFYGSTCTFRNKSLQVLQRC